MMGRDGHRRPGSGRGGLLPGRPGTGRPGGEPRARRRRRVARRRAGCRRRRPARAGLQWLRLREPGRGQSQRRGGRRRDGHAFGRGSPPTMGSSSWAASANSPPATCSTAPHSSTPAGYAASTARRTYGTGESLWFSPGSAAPPVIPTRFGRIAVMICYDLEFPEWVRLPALDGAQLLCAPANWPALPRPDGERPAEVVRVQADAAVNRMFIAACDRTGEERGVAWVEGSGIVDADGWPLACAAPAGGPVIITAE